MAGILRISRWFWVAPVLAVAASCASGQVVSGSAEPTVVEDVLHGMSDRAAVIFAGQVVAVRRNGGKGFAPGVVEVEFRVDHAVRGCTMSGSYVLREWGGLWSGGVERYRVGQRFLMMLHAPGAGGMGSPVDGMDGAIPIRGGGATAIAGQDTTAQSVVDLRWLGARVGRKVRYRSGAALPPTPFIVAQTIGGGTGAGAVDVSAASVPVEETTVDAVVGRLMAWEKVQDASR